MTKKRNSAKKKKINKWKITYGKFWGCKVSRSPRISPMDCPHQQQMLPSLLPTPHVVDGPPEFLSEGNEHVASWSEVKGR